jgi:hypothetical protein
MPTRPFTLSPAETVQYLIDRAAAGFCAAKRGWGVLEIFVVAILWRNIGKIVAAKGRKRLPYQLMVVAAWLGGEVVGLFVGMIVDMIATGNEEPSLLFPYFTALTGAAAGAYISFLIAKAMPPIMPAEPADGYSSPAPPVVDERIAAWPPPVNDSVAGPGQSPEPQSPGDYGFSAAPPPGPQV